MVGLLMSVGNFGAVVATTPLAWAAGNWGWRPTFFLIGAITLAMAIVMLTVTRDAPAPAPAAGQKHQKPDTRSPGLLRSTVTIVWSRQFWLLAAVFFGFYGTAVALQGLWATPFLMAVLDVERILASKVNMLIPIGVIIGAPLFGWLPNRFLLNNAPVAAGVELNIIN